MEAILWTKPDCDNCLEVKKKLEERGYNIEEHLADDLLNGNEFNHKAVKFLMDQKQALPVVCLDGNFIKFDEI